MLGNWDGIMKRCDVSRSQKTLVLRRLGANVVENFDLYKTNGLLPMGN